MSLTTADRLFNAGSDKDAFLQTTPRSHRCGSARFSLVRSKQYQDKVADKEGFEPSNELPRYTLSKRAP